MIYSEAVIIAQAKCLLNKLPVLLLPCMALLVGKVENNVLLIQTMLY